MKQTKAVVLEIPSSRSQEAEDGEAKEQNKTLFIQHNKLCNVLRFPNLWKKLLSLSTLVKRGCVTVLNKEGIIQNL